MWHCICLAIGQIDSHDGIITAPPPTGTSPTAVATGARIEVGTEAFGEAGFCMQGVGREGSGREWEGRGMEEDGSEVGNGVNPAVCHA